MRLLEPTFTAKLARASKPKATYQFGVAESPVFMSRGNSGYLPHSVMSPSRCSLGLAFVVNSIEYLTEGGELIAVLPQGSLTSEKDATTWSLLRRMGETEIVKTNGLRTFARAAVRTAVVRFQKRHNWVKPEPFPVVNARNDPHNLHPTVQIVRGTTQMNSIQARRGIHRFIHAYPLNQPPRLHGVISLRSPWSSRALCGRPNGLVTTGGPTQTK